MHHYDIGPANINEMLIKISLDQYPRGYNEA